MSDNTESALGIGLILLIGVLIGFTVGLCVGVSKGEFSGTKSQQQAAVDAGVARWTVDQKTGEKQFQFVQCGEQP